MTRLKECRIIGSSLAIALTLFGGAAHSEMLNEDAGPAEIGPVSVRLHDNAVGACWTNLKEVREYAEEKLRIQGYTLGEDDDAMINYTLVVNVDAFRSKAAPVCVGSIAVYLWKGSVENGIFGFHTIAMGNVVTTSSLSGNVNDRVIEVVQKVVDDM